MTAFGAESNLPSLLSEIGALSVVGEASEVGMLLTSVG